MPDLGRTLIAAAEREPHATAIVDGTARFDYATWFDVANRLAGELAALGIERGDRLAVVLQNRWEAAALHWTCQLAGAVTVPLNWRSTAAELDFFLRDSGAAALAFDDVAQNCYRAGERTLGVMPLYHTMGVRALLAMALLNGAFVCQPRFEAARALRLIESERITSLYLVPTLYHDLLASTAFPGADISSVRRLGFAGAPMTGTLLRRVADAFQPDLFVNHYGSSEIYSFTVAQDARAKPGSAGINQRIRVVEIGANDPHRTVAPGAEGEVIASLESDEAFAGYWRRPDADARALKQGWYFTGDVGYCDADDDLFVTGRVDDMIITGGENVLPAELESVLAGHPAIADVAVAGLPDERWGQKVAAFVTRAGPVDAASLDAHCRASSLAGFKRPRAYVFVRAIPKSPVGKILRRLLIAGDYETDEADKGGAGAPTEGRQEP